VECDAGVTLREKTAHTGRLG